MMSRRFLSLSLSFFVWALIPLLPLSRINATEIQVGDETATEEWLSADIKSQIKLANNLAVSGKYKEASIIYENILEELKGFPKFSAKDKAEGINNLAVLYAFQGLYGKAELLHRRALAIREKALGPDHPDTAESLSNLGGLYSAQGLYNKTEPLYERSLVIREKALGPDHPDTGLALNNLALLYYTQGL